jgi:uncharacterized membrane protein YfcA
VSDSHVRLAVGVIALGFVLSRWLGGVRSQAQRPMVPKGLFWGGVSGFTSMLCQAGGPPFQVYVMPQQLAKLTFVGTMTIFFATLNLIKIVPYFALGQFSSTGFATSIALVPLAVATNFLGIWLVRITPVTLFYKVSYILVFLVALALVHMALTDLLA